MSIYKSAEGRTNLLAYYDAAVDRMGVPYEDLYVNTRFGRTHVLAMGPREAPPLVIFHGGNVVNPVSLRWFVPLMADYRIYAPDTNGHPGKSAETRMSANGNDYAHWVTDLMDGLGLERADMMGPSYGGGILLRTAAVAPERIDRAVLIVPSSIYTSLWSMTREIILPMLLYMLAPTEARLTRAVQPMLTEPVATDPELLRFCGVIYRATRLEPAMPRTVRAEELRHFTAPTLLFAADNDIFFPGARVIERARQIFPNLVGTELLAASRHYPSREGQAFICERIRTFLCECR